MKICLLGEEKGIMDEAMRITTLHLAQELSSCHEILVQDPRGALSRRFWKRLKRFDPQIIHYIHGPSIGSLLLLKILSLVCPGAREVMSATHPYFPFLAAGLIPLLKPDIILTQSRETEKRLQKLGCRTEFLPSGVDLERFTPATTETKIALREKYGIARDKFVILHVGAISKGRNIRLLSKLKKEGDQVLLIGSPSAGIDGELSRELQESGCLVWTDYIPEVEEIYALSDCYIFPVENKESSIEMPLSVLEAMACNLPVICTRFGALARVFQEGEGLIFTNTDFPDKVEEVKGGLEVRTRERVLPYSWQNIALKLKEIYSNILDSKGQS